jgi:hypothetical protein
MPHTTLGSNTWLQRGMCPYPILKLVYSSQYTGMSIANQVDIRTSINHLFLHTF